MFLQIQQSLQKLLDKLTAWIDAVVLILPNLFVALMVLGLSYIASGYLKKGTTKALFRATGNLTVVGVLSNVIVALFMVVVLFVVLSILNLDDAFTALLGTAGVLGLAVGLALQDPLINLFSGILMSVRDNYSIGDFVETNSHLGNITKITLRTTILRTNSGQDVVIPNKDVLQNPLVNYTRSGERRVELDCGVSYGEDLRRVKKITSEAIKSSDIKLKEGKPIEVFFKEFDESSINFVLRFWPVAIAQRDYFDARDKAIIAVKEAFDANGITIPFPIRTLDFGIVGGVRLDEMKLQAHQQGGKENGK